MVMSHVALETDGGELTSQQEAKLTLRQEIALKMLVEAGVSNEEAVAVVRERLLRVGATRFLFEIETICSFMKKGATFSDARHLVTATQEAVDKYLAVLSLCEVLEIVANKKQYHS